MSIKKSSAYAWIVVLLSAFLLFYKYVALVFPSLIATDIKLHFGIDSAQIGALSAMFLYLILLVQPFAGLLLDRFGCRNVTTISLMITALGMLLFAISSSLTIAFIGRAMMGIGVAFATVSYMKAVSTWFDEKNFAIASTLLLTAGMLGAIAGQAPLSMLFSSVGWQFGLYVCAIIGVIAAVVYWLVIRDDSQQNIDTNINSKTGTLQVIKTITVNPNNWLLMIYSGLIFTTIDAFGGLWGNSFFAIKYDLTTTQSGFYISAIFLGMGIGAPIMGKLSKHFNSIRIMLVCALVGLLSLAAILYLYLALPTLMFSCFIYGAMTSSFMLVFVVGRKLNPLAVMATAAALINTGEPIFGGIFEMLVGKILDLLEPQVTGTHYSVNAYEIAFSILPVSIFLAVIALCFVKVPRR